MEYYFSENIIDLDDYCGTSITETLEWASSENWELVTHAVFIHNGKQNHCLTFKRPKS